MPRILVVLCALLCAIPAAAQTATQAQLRLVIVDETGAGIPAVTITATPAAGAPVTVTADERGVATIATLPVGDVRLHVEFLGFDPVDQSLTLRRGANNQTVTMKVAGLQDEVLVSDTTSTDDRRGNSLTTTLETDQIAELPDDPDDLADVLTQMAGGNGAVFQVNGFRGGRLPSRDEIRQIRFRTNSFSADNHDAGRTQVEIITRPNVREWSGNANMNFRSDVMNARNAFAQSKTPEENRSFNLGLRGPIVANKTSIRLNLDGRRNNESDTIVAIDESGTRLGEYVRRPSDSTNVTVGIEHALTRNETLRVEVRAGENSTLNNGVGGFNLADHAYDRSGRSKQLRAQVQGLVGKTSLNELRVQYAVNDNEQSSRSDVPTIVVLDAFTRGGAGINSRGKTRSLEVADNFDFNVGRKQQMRVGFLVEGGHYENFDARNAAGTFTFSSIDAFLAGTPATFTQRLGEVNTQFNQYQVGFYWQDDYRLNNRLSLSVGLRNEMQSHIDDAVNLMPRFGFTWTPKGNRTSIRGGYGLFYDWYESSLYDQTLRVNGIAQRDLLILNPGFPDPSSGVAADTQPGGRIQAARDLSMPMVHQASIGIERQVRQNFSVQASYQALRGFDELRSININAPNELGVRPDPTVGTVTQFESTGKSQSDRLTFQGNVRFPQRRMFLNASYTLGQVKNHADSATQLPANNLDPEAEWGPSARDIRHEFHAFGNLPLPLGVRANLNINAQSAAPYTITTGRDDNRDGIVNDRPEGVGRNSARGAATWTISTRISRSFGLGGARGGQAGGGQGGPRTPGGGAPAARQLTAPQPAAPAQQPNFQRGPGGRGPAGGGPGGDAAFNQKYSVELFVSADNILNRVNYGAFSGNQLSPFFGRPTYAQRPRQIQIGMQFRF